MRVLWLVLLVGIPAWMAGQSALFQPDSIPLNDDVVFEARFETHLSQDEINTRINQFISKILNPVAGKIVEKSPSHTVCEIVDYLTVGDNFFHSFGVYMIYQLELSAEHGLSNLKINDIHFLEKGYFEAYMNPSDTRALPLMPAREILVERKFRQMFVKDASLRVTESAIERINALTEELNHLFEVSEMEEDSKR